MTISAVIPTCNRRQSLLKTLQALNASGYPLHEVIIADAGNEPLCADELNTFSALDIHYFHCDIAAVCIQRNAAIKLATGDFIFLCDDDVETPADYLQQLVEHRKRYPDCGAMSGLVLQQQDGEWVSDYPLRSASQLLHHYVFGTSIWGPVEVNRNGWPFRRIKKSFSRKGNHLSKAGWPVITQMRGEYFTVPSFGLGAALIRRSWLLEHGYDEVLDPHGIGDHYGVAVQLPVPVHVLPTAFVYHHQEKINRLMRPLQYYRRVLALDYFRRKRLSALHSRKHWLLWSLTGNFLGFCLVKDWQMLRPSLKAIRLILFNRNPYMRAAAAGQKTISPEL